MAPQDTYTHGHHDAVLRSHRWRTVANSAAYLEPELRADAELLDVGCGPGTITAELGERLERGRVVGIDRAREVLDEARRTTSHLSNVEIRAGDVYALEFADHSFDVVHAHQVLQHLSDPVAALREMRRVCRPTGVVACRDSDYGSFGWNPADPVLDAWLSGYRAAARANRAEPDAGRFLERWALDAGFASVRATQSRWCFRTLDERRWWADLWAGRVTQSALRDQLVAKGLASEADCQAFADAFQRWAAAPGAQFSVPHGEILALP